MADPFFSSLILYYEPVITSAQEYYPFGMMMRQSQAGKYRFGFNGKENDNEVKGLGNQQDYGERIYDPRCGCFLSVDPIAKQYPELSPYQFASRRPIDGIDLDGKEFLKTIPKFEYSGENNWVDYVSAIDNGVIDVVNLVPTTWNSIVATAQSLKRGTYIKDLTSEAKQTASALNQSANKFIEAPFKTLSSPESVEFFTSAFVGAKVFTPTASTGNLLKSVKPSEPTITLYRGVNESNIAFESSAKGIVKPNGGIATPLEHNTVSTLNSPFTSWTTNPAVAENFALRPSGSGVVLKITVPLRKVIKSPNTKEVLLKGTNQRVSESELLLKGRIVVKPENITKVSN